MLPVITFVLAALKDAIPLAHSVVALFRKKKVDTAAIKNIDTGGLSDSIVSKGDDGITAVDGVAAINAIDEAKKAISLKPELNLNPIVRFIGSLIGLWVTSYLMTKMGVKYEDIKNLWGLLQ